MMAELDILKIGGSVITDKTKPLSVNVDVINNIATEMLSIKSRVVLVHGGGSFGHPLAKKYNLSEGIQNSNQVIGIAETHQAMLNLNKILMEIFISKEIPVIPFSPHGIFLTRSGRIYIGFLEPIKKSLDVGMIPVLFGDTVHDVNQKIKILSGDQLVSYLAAKLKARRIIIGTDTDGIYTNDPKIDPKAQLIPEITPLNYKDILRRLRSSSINNVIDVTGGMYGKIRELLRAARRGIDIYIINAKKPLNIKKLFEGKEILCTRFKGWKLEHK